MSGLYLHIPFCKQACTYCDFHFSTNLGKKERMVEALIEEMRMRQQEADGEIQTIYFGGGTPSVLSADEINHIIESAYEIFTVAGDAEITLEANPDDLSDAKIKELADSKINRLSIGIQSFFDEDLAMMNRAHNASEAEKSLAEARKYFDNITIDLIYGTPGMSDIRWKENIEKALSFDVPHVSAYALTVEPRTALKKLIADGKVAKPKDEVAENHFRILTEILSANGFIQYEISNFGKPGFFSKNNSAYWLGKKYIGIGPSAHSYDGKSRSWNVANNSLYLKGIASANRDFETEELTLADQYNEYIMTGLRTIWGVSLEKIQADFGLDFRERLLTDANRFIEGNLLKTENGNLVTTEKGKFLADGLASDLFITED